MTRYLLTLAMFLGLQACDGTTTGKDESPPGDDDDDDDDAAPTGDSVPDGDDVFVPYVVLLSANLTYQGGALVDLTTDEGDVGPTVLATLGTAEWSFDYADTANYCQVQGEITDDATPGFVAVLDLSAGASYTDGPLQSSCDGIVFDGTFDPGFLVVDTLGAGIGPRSAESQDFIDQIGPPADEEEQYLGAGFNIPYITPPTETGTAFAFGYQIDANREIVLGGDGYGVPLTVSDMTAAEPGVPDGTYFVYAGGLVFQ